jgi:hypothetical protein
MMDILDSYIEKYKSFDMNIIKSFSDIPEFRKLQIIKLEEINSEFLSEIFNHKYSNHKEFYDTIEYIISNLEFDTIDIINIHMVEYDIKQFMNSLKDVMLNRRVYTHKLRYNDTINDIFINNTSEISDLFDRLKKSFRQNISTSSLSFSISDIYLQYFNVKEASQNQIVKVEDVMQPEVFVRFLYDIRGIFSVSEKGSVDYNNLKFGILSDFVDNHLSHDKNVDFTRFNIFNIDLRYVSEKYYYEVDGIIQQLVSYKVSVDAMLGGQSFLSKLYKKNKLMVTNVNNIVNERQKQSFNTKTMMSKISDPLMTNISSMGNEHLGFYGIKDYNEVIVKGVDANIFKSVRMLKMCIDELKKKTYSEESLIKEFLFNLLEVKNRFDLWNRVAKSYDIRLGIMDVMIENFGKILIRDIFFNHKNYHYQSNNRSGYLFPLLFLDVAIKRGVDFKYVDQNIVFGGLIRIRNIIDSHDYDLYNVMDYLFKNYPNQQNLIENFFDYSYILLNDVELTESKFDVIDNYLRSLRKIRRGSVNLPIGVGRWVDNSVDILRYQNSYKKYNVTPKENEKILNMITNLNIISNIVG